MDHFNEEYLQRKSEIENYLNLLKLLDQDGIKITSLDDADGTTIPGNAFQVAKASFYLVLYNLAEATINAGVQSIYNRISDENLSFSEIIEPIQKVWWIQHHEKLSNCSKNQLVDNIFSLYKSCINTAIPPDFKGFVAGISGSIDAEGVRKVCHKYGINTIGDGRELELVKKNRNWLSHGNKSFREVGQDVVLSDLEVVRNKTFEFMDGFVTNITEYLSAKTYKNTG